MKKFKFSKSLVNVTKISGGTVVGQVISIVTLPFITRLYGAEVLGIMNLEDYYKKRVSLQYEEAKDMVKKYRERYGKEIDDYSLREHFWLFSGKNTKLHDEWKRVMTFAGNEDECYQVLQGRNPYYQNKEDFLNSIK